VDGQVVSITAPLKEALRDLRLEEEILVIWADSLSINQDDDSEKSWQVQQMTHIYEAATGVLAWLGPIGQDSTALDFLANIGQEAYNAGIRNNILIIDIQSITRPDTREDLLLTKYTLLNIADRTMRQFCWQDMNRYLSHS